MRSLPICAYLSDRSMPMHDRQRCCATTPVVPLPKKGSRTVAGTTPVSCLHDGSQPVVVVVDDMPDCSGEPRARKSEALLPRALAVDVRSMIRRHGAPHSAQQPFSLVQRRSRGEGSQEGTWRNVTRQMEQEFNVRHRAYFVCRQCHPSRYLILDHHGLTALAACNYRPLMR